MIDLSGQKYTDVDHAHSIAQNLGIEILNLLITNCEGNDDAPVSMHF